MPRSRGNWRGKPLHLANNEWSVGPQKVELDGSNYRGARGATLRDIRQMAIEAKMAGSQTLWIGTLIRRTSLPRGFRWVSASNRTPDEFIKNINDGLRKGISEDEFARRFHGTQYPVSGAISWTIISY